MSVVQMPTQLPLKRASDIAALQHVPRRAARSMATQYWRRTQFMREPAHKLPALQVFDESLVNSLAAIKTHLIHEPSSETCMLEELTAVAQELQDKRVSSFAWTCLQALKQQIHPEVKMTDAVWDLHLREQPDAVFDALRFCFNETIATCFISGIAQAFDHSIEPLTLLLTRLAIARPAVSDAFAQAIAERVRPLEGGLNALCLMRCLMEPDEAKARRAIEAGQQAEAALIMLSLCNSPLELEMARFMIQLGSVSRYALAICAAKEPSQLMKQWQQGQLDHAPIAYQLYAAALVGHVGWLSGLAKQIDWDDRVECRALADATALICGADTEPMYTKSFPAPERQQAFVNLLAQLESQPSLRINQVREQVSLRDAIIHVGVDLRAMLYVEYTARYKAALWIEADDLAAVQSLAVATNTIFESAMLQGALS
jgi:hypothetical protein